MKKLCMSLLCAVLILSAAGCGRRQDDRHLSSPAGDDPFLNEALSPPADTPPATDDSLGQIPAGDGQIQFPATIDPFEKTAGAEGEAPIWSSQASADYVVSPTQDNSEPAPDSSPVNQIAEAALDAPASGSDRTLDVAAVELELLRLINAERVSQGIEPLGMQDSLRWAAQIRAPEVIDSLSHTRPDGTPYYTAMDETGFIYAGKWHGENVSCMYFAKGLYDSAEAAEKIFDSLKSSPGHYRNMLSDNFLQVGIGAYVHIRDKTVQMGSAQLFAGA